MDIEIFSITGNAVKKVIMDAFKAAGPHSEDTWLGINELGIDVVPGTYFCQITVRYVSGREEVYRRKIAVVR